MALQETTDPCYVSDYWTATNTGRSGGSLIGCHIPDLQDLHLDGQGEPVPIGVAGEFYIGGAGVARGI